MPDAPPELGSNGTRAVLHVDMDAFYVSVELRRRPELRGRPVVVGGTGQRGVVAAASYEARRFGVYSAMSSVVARRRCPDAVFLPGDHELYAQVSREVHAIFHSVTPLVEPLALDEAFLDITGAIRLFGSARRIADHVRARVADELQLPCSVGGATNKFLAKLASKGAKPRVSPQRVDPGPGVLLIAPGAELEFLHPLPVSALWGVGPATLKRLERFGVKTVGDLARIDPAGLVTALGSAQGRHLHELAWGRDSRPVEPDREAKSIGHEETFRHDRFTHADLHREAVRLADAVSARLRSAGVGARTITIKVRFSDFVTITRSRSVAAPITTAKAVVEIADALLAAIDVGAGVRLFGISASGLGPAVEQLSLDDLTADMGAGRGEADRSDWVTASGAIDAIRERFGAGAIGPASTVSPNGLRVVRAGAQQWGPDQVAPRTDDTTPSE